MKTKLLLMISLLGIGLVSFEWKEDTLIQGTVMDQGTKEKLIGANVMIKGTKEGTITDVDGKFSFKTSLPLPLTLEISYVGYATKEVKVKKIKAPLNIYLDGNQMELEEVVVGYAVEKKRLFGNRKDRNVAKSYGYNAPPVAYGDHITPAPSHYAYEPDHNTEDYSVIQENRFLEVSKEPLSTFSIDVDAASYANMRRFITNGQKPPKDAVRIEEMVNYFNYDYPQPKGEHPFEVITEIGECPWNADHRLVHVGLQGKKVATENLPPSNLVFLIDVSGSMRAYNKLPLLQSSFKLLADQLRAEDRVAIVVYAGAAGAVLPSTSGANKQKIKEAISNLQAGGSTAGAAGINLAYKIAKENFVEGGNNRVILATDGDFNVGTSSDAELVRLIEEKRKSDIFLTIMGFGTGNYKDNKMQQLANKGNGNHAYIDNLSEARKVLVNEFGGTLFTIAKDVKFQLEFNPTKVKGYRLIGYENRMLQNEDFNDDQKDAGELGAGHTVTAIYEVIPVGVDSDFFADVDPLKYQKSSKPSAAAKSKELLTIKLRYKKPDGDKSRLLERPVIDRNLDLAETSDNFRWSAAVAQFGMLLRDSEFKQASTYDHAISLAKNAKGTDTNGYRAELIRMMEDIRALEDTQVGMKE